MEGGQKMLLQIPTVEDLAPLMLEELGKKTILVLPFHKVASMFSQCFTVCKSERLTNEMASRIANDVTLLLEEIFNFVQHKTNENEQIMHSVSKFIENEMNSLFNSLSGPTRCEMF
jgi:hypothetical protein